MQDVSGNSSSGDSDDAIMQEDDFLLQDVIGSGGMGVVYRAWQPSLDRHIAVKQLHCHLPHDDPLSAELISRFRREVLALGKVQHPNLISIYSTGVTKDGWLYYSMELLEGAGLSHVLRELIQQREDDLCSWQHAVDRSAGNGEKSVGDAPEDYVRQVVAIVREVALAAQALHEAGIVHRDIKPGNIMIDSDGGHATLMDLGLAGLLSERGVRLTQTGQVIGSLPYISPEQFSGSSASEHADIYNLGAILWELLTRRRLFDCTNVPSTAALIHRITEDGPESVRKFEPKVSRDLDAVVLKSLEKRPEQRYESVEAFIEDLDRAQQQQPVCAKRRSLLVTRILPTRRIRGLATWVLGIALVQISVTTAIVKALKADSSAVAKSETGNSDSFTSTDAARAIHDSSLVAWWSGEGSGSVAIDESGHGGTGALIGRTSRIPGVVGKAFEFHGKGDYITFGRASRWNFLHNGSPFTVSCFVAPATAVEDGGILCTMDELSTSGNRQGLLIRLYMNHVEFRVQSGAGPFAIKCRTEAALPAGEFSAVAVTFDGTTARVYVDGRLSTSTTPQTPFISDTAPDALSIGSVGTPAGPNGQAFEMLEGSVDEVQLYERALSADEVRYLAGIRNVTE